MKKNSFTQVYIVTIAMTQITISFLENTTLPLRILILFISCLASWIGCSLFNYFCSAKLHNHIEWCESNLNYTHIVNKMFCFEPTWEIVRHNTEFAKKLLDSFSESLKTEFLNGNMELNIHTWWLSSEKYIIFRFEQYCNCIDFDPHRTYLGFNLVADDYFIGTGRNGNELKRYPITTEGLTLLEIHYAFINQIRNGKEFRRLKIFKYAEARCEHIEDYLKRKTVDYFK